MGGLTGGRTAEKSITRHIWCICSGYFEEKLLNYREILFISKVQPYEYQGSSSQVQPLRDKPEQTKRINK